jgi:hypothetical protein
MNLFLRTILFLIIALNSATISVAQGPAPPPPLNEVPLDGFVILLFVLGAGYVALTLNNKNSPKTNP